MGRHNKYKNFTILSRDTLFIVNECLGKAVLYMAETKYFTYEGGIYPYEAYATGVATYTYAPANSHQNEH